MKLQYVLVAVRTMSGVGWGVQFMVVSRKDGRGGERRRTTVDQVLRDEIIGPNTRLCGSGELPAPAALLLCTATERPANDGTRSGARFRPAGIAKELRHDDPEVYDTSQARKRRQHLSRNLETR